MTRCQQWGRSFSGSKLMSREWPSICIMFTSLRIASSQPGHLQKGIPPIFRWPTYILIKRLNDMCLVSVTSLIKKKSRINNVSRWFLKSKTKNFNNWRFWQLKINSEPGLEMSSHPYMVHNKEWKGPTMRVFCPNGEVTRNGSSRPLSTYAVGT